MQPSSVFYGNNNEKSLLARPLLPVGLLSLLFILFLSFQPAGAQTCRFGYISTSRLVALMPESAEADARMRREVRSLEEELQKLNNEYQQKLQKYVEEQEILTSVVRQSRERELMELQNRIQDFQAGAQESLQERRMELLQPIFNKIEKAVDEVARERGYTLVFDLDNSSLLYMGDDTEDIMPYVREKLGL